MYNTYDEYAEQEKEAIKAPILLDCIREVEEIKDKFTQLIW